MMGSCVGGGDRSASQSERDGVVVVVPHQAPAAAPLVASAPVMQSPMQAALSTAAALAAASAVGTKEAPAAEHNPQLPPPATLATPTAPQCMQTSTKMLPLRFAPPAVGTTPDGTTRNPLFAMNPLHHQQQPALPAAPGTRAPEPPSVFAQMKLRRGKWTPEEETYADLLIAEFERGTVEDCENGCTLRAFLSKKLHCAPMRISKKYAGKSIGKHVFLARKNIPGATPTQPNRVKLRELELAFYQSLLHDDRRHPTTTAAVTAYLAAVAAAAAPTALAYSTLQPPNPSMGPPTMSTVSTSIGHHHTGPIYTHHPQQLHGTAATAIPYISSISGASALPESNPSAATATAPVHVRSAQTGFLQFPAPGHTLVLPQSDSVEQQKKRLQQTYLSALRGNGGAQAVTVPSAGSTQSTVAAAQSSRGPGHVKMTTKSETPIGASSRTQINYATNRHAVTVASAPLPVMPVPAHHQAKPLPAVSLNPIPSQHQKQQPTSMCAAKQSHQALGKNEEKQPSHSTPKPPGPSLEIPDFLVGFEKVAASKNVAVTTGTTTSAEPVTSSPPLTSRSFDDFHRYLGKGLSPAQPMPLPLEKTLPTVGQEERLSVPRFELLSPGNSHPQPQDVQSSSGVSADSYAVFAQESAHAVMQHSAYNGTGSSGNHHQQECLPQLSIPNVIEEARQTIVSSPSPMSAQNLRVHHALHLQQQRALETQSRVPFHHHPHHAPPVVSEQSEEGGESEDSNSEPGMASSGARKRKREEAGEGLGRALAKSTN